MLMACCVEVVCWLCIFSYYFLLWKKYCLDFVGFYLVQKSARASRKNHTVANQPVGLKLLGTDSTNRPTCICNKNMHQVMKCIMNFVLCAVYVQWSLFRTPGVFFFLFMREKNDYPRSGVLTDIWLSINTFFESELACHHTDIIDL